MGQVVDKEKFYSKTIKFNQERTKKALNDFGSEFIVTMSTHVFLHPLRQGVNTVNIT